MTSEDSKSLEFFLDTLSAASNESVDDLTWFIEGSLGTMTAVATLIESTKTDSTASAGTVEVFFFGTFFDSEDAAEVAVEVGEVIELLDDDELKKFGMLTGNVGNFIRALATSEDFSTPLKMTEGL